MAYKKSKTRRAGRVAAKVVRPLAARESPVVAPSRDGDLGVVAVVPVSTAKVANAVRQSDSVRDLLLWILGYHEIDIAPRIAMAREAFKTLQRLLEGYESVGADGGSRKRQ